MEEQSKSGRLRGPEPKKGTVVGEASDDGKEVSGQGEPQQEVGGGQREATHCVTKNGGMQICEG